MAISFVDATSATNFSNGYVDVPAPSGIQDGDILLAFLVSNSTGSISWPSGFTELGTRATAAARLLGVAWKRASSESGAYRLDGPGGVNFGQVACFRGCETSGNPYDQWSNTAYTTNDVNIRAAGFTTTVETSIVHFAWDGVDYTITSPSGFTLAEYQKDTYVQNIAYKLAVAAGATGDIDATMSSATANEKHAFMMALKAGGASQTVQPTGISSTEAFGSPTLTPGAVTVEPTGISSAEAWGSPTVSPGGVTVKPESVPSVEALGSPTVTQATVVQPIGVASGEAFGSPVVARMLEIVEPQGIPSAEAFGQPVALPGGVTIEPQSIPSAEALGSPALIPIIQPTGITSAETFGLPAILAGSVILQPAGIPSAEGFGTPMVALALVTIEPTGIPSAEAFGTPRLRITAKPSGISSAEAFGVPTVLQPSLQTVQPTGISSGEAFGAVVVNGIRLLPEANYELSILDVANKVWVVVEGSSPLVVGSATNDTTDPRFSVSPREMVVTIKDGNASKCNTVAAAHLALRKVERYRLNNLPVPLRYGLQIRRGQQVRVVIPRAGIDVTLPVRRIQHDFGSSVTTVDVGEFAMARDDVSAVVDIAKALAQLEKEVAI